MIRPITQALVLASLLMCSAEIAGQSVDTPTLLPWSKQIAVREEWLARHA